MLWELLRGILLGTFTGLTPGIHVNTIGNLQPGRNLELFSMGITHTFLDAVPSAFFGVPEEGTALSVLPAHGLVMEGRGMEVVKLSLWASALSVWFSILLTPLYLLIAPQYFSGAGRALVLFLAVMMILTAGKKAHLAAFIFLLSGVLGCTVFSFSLRNPYYLLFTGLFGVPVILTSGSKIPGPGDGSIKYPAHRFIIISLFGTLAGMLASLVPSFTPSQAALFFSPFSRDRRAFLIGVFSTNTSNFVFSFVNYAATGRIRNGVVANMNPVSIRGLPVYALVALTVSLMILLYGERVANIFVGALSKVPYRAVNAGVLAFILTLAVVFDGLLGLLVFMAASLVGMLPQRLGVRRTTCMGVLMMPIIMGV